MKKHITSIGLAIILVLSFLATGLAQDELMIPLEEEKEDVLVDEIVIVEEKKEQITTKAVKDVKEKEEPKNDEEAFVEAIIAQLDAEEQVKVKKSLKKWGKRDPLAVLKNKIEVYTKEVIAE